MDTSGLFGLVVVIVAVVVIFKELAKKSESKSGTASYQKRGRVMNASEQALFINLQKTLGGEYMVLSKVRIEDFVDVDKEESQNNRWGLRGQIKSRHVDFLICNNATTKPLLAIELDGKSHNASSRQDRDKFVDDLYKAISLPVEHIPVGADFSKSAQDIKNVLIAVK